MMRRIFLFLTHSFLLQTSHADTSKQYIANAVEDNKNNCQFHTLVDHPSYYCCKLSLCCIHVPCHSVKIYNLERYVLMKVLKYRKYLVRHIQNFHSRYTYPLENMRFHQGYHHCNLETLTDSNFGSPLYLNPGSATNPLSSTFWMFA